MRVITRSEYTSKVVVSLVALVAAACQGRLAVTDDPIGNGGSGQVPPIGNGGSAVNPEHDAGTGGTGGFVSVDAVNPEPEPTCDDGVRNGDETGLDCGGACAACVTPCDCASSAAFMALGCELGLGGGTPVGYANSPRPSADGNAVAFDLCYEDNSCKPFYWSLTGGAAAMPALPGGASVSGLSADGSKALVHPLQALAAQALLYDVQAGTSEPTGILPHSALLSASGSVVGFSSTTNDSSQLARKAPGGQLEQLGEIPLPADRVLLTGVALDASAIVGYGWDPQNAYVSFRWTQADGIVLGAGTLPEGADAAIITALSGDGTSFAGVTLAGNRRLSVFHSSAATGLVEVGPALLYDTPGIDPLVMALNGDGSVLAATLNIDTDGFGAFRWTEATGAVAMAPGTQSVASHVSADGAVVIGKTLDDQYGPFAWTEAAHTRSVRATLESAGVDFRGWTTHSIMALSSDGKVAIGSGSCGDTQTLYRVVLPE